jgi:hypothetical protein
VSTLFFPPVHRSLCVGECSSCLRACALVPRALALLRHLASEATLQKPAF